MTPGDENPEDALETEELSDDELGDVTAGGPFVVRSTPTPGV